MKTLILMRHAKASRDDPAMPDQARPLTPRGLRDSPRIGRWLVEQEQLPQFVLVSTSVRTRQTWEQLAPLMGEGAEVSFRDDLYLADAEKLNAIVRALPARASSVMIVGHNPGLEEFAATLASTGDRASRKALSQKFPTSAVAIIRFARGSWKSLTDGCLTAFQTPKLLGE